MPTVDIPELFADEKREGLNIYLGGRPTVEHVALSADEEDAITACVQEQVRALEKTAPELAKGYNAHLSSFIKFAGIAKGVFPIEKPIEYPSRIGTIGCAGLIPQAVKYAATPSDTEPCYTDYKTNLWEIDLTAGTAAYIFGDGANFYKASPTTNKHSMIVCIQDGLIEIGSTPKLQQSRFTTEAETKYGITTIHPVAELPIEKGTTLFQYNTFGVVPIYHDFGIKWEVMPCYTGTSIIKMLGMVFFEHEFLSTLTWL